MWLPSSSDTRTGLIYALIKRKRLSARSCGSRTHAAFTKISKNGGMGDENIPLLVSCGRRASPRLRLRLPAHLITLEGQGPALLENISATGARVASRLGVRAGTSCVVRVQGLELFADVAWSINDRCGLVFERPLTQQQLLKMRELEGVPTQNERSARQEWARRFVEGSVGR